MDFAELNKIEEGIDLAIETQIEEQRHRKLMARFLKENKESRRMDTNTDGKKSPTTLRRVA